MFILKIRKADRESLPKMVLLGFLTALAVLSRVDAVFIFITITLDLWYLSYRKSTSLFKSLSNLRSTAPSPFWSYHPGFFGTSIISAQFGKSVG